MSDIENIADDVMRLSKDAGFFAEFTVQAQTRLSSLQARLARIQNVPNVTAQAAQINNLLAQAKTSLSATTSYMLVVENKGVFYAALLASRSRNPIIGKIDIPNLGRQRSPLGYLASLAFGNLLPAKQLRKKMGLTRRQKTRFTTVQIEKWIKDINPMRLQDNCGSTAFMVFSKLAGLSPSPEVAGNFTRTNLEMEKMTGLGTVKSSPEEIESTLRKIGPGAHAVVGVENNRWGHWLNAYYDGTNVYYLDGQSGTITEWPPTIWGDNDLLYWDASFGRLI